MKGSEPETHPVFSGFRGQTKGITRGQPLRAHMNVGLAWANPEDGLLGVFAEGR